MPFKVEVSKGRKGGKSMWYLISQLWLFLLIAVLVGFYVGWSTSDGSRS
jgi:hypothetical protein